ncbi:MAG: zf-HC2 domain-containing protein [Vicinamibacterales bacterium]
MMNDALCTYDGRRDEVLVAYLYDDIDAAERHAFETHLAACLPCRTELDALADVREGLAAWAAPETAEGVGGRAPRSALRIVKADSDPAPVRTSGWRVLADAPLWMQAAAAMLVVAASLGLANINLTYSREGLTLTSGWLKSAPPAPSAGEPALTTTVSNLASENAELRQALTSLRSQIETIRTQTVSAPAARQDDAVVTRQVKTQLQESERRQQRELDSALRRDGARLPGAAAVGSRAVRSRARRLPESNRHAGDAATAAVERSAAPARVGTALARGWATWQGAEQEPCAE